MGRKKSHESAGYDDQAAASQASEDAAINTALEAPPEPDDGTEAGPGANGAPAKAPLTPEQRARRAERAAQRPHYWLVRVGPTGAPMDVIQGFRSARIALRKIAEYTRVLRVKPAEIIVVRVKPILPKEWYHAE